jgi:hypothetical protein
MGECGYDPYEDEWSVPTLKKWFGDEVPLCAPGFGDGIPDELGDETWIMGEESPAVEGETGRLSWSPK